MPDYSYTEPAVLAFIVIPVALAICVIAGVWFGWRRAGEPVAAAARAALLMAVGSAVWMGVTWAVAARGTFRQWDRVPPSMAVLAVLIMALSFRLALGGVGRRLARLPLWILVGIQGFRLPLELAMHQMFERGIMPEQMSYSGRNFDIVSGITALIVAALLVAGRGGKALVAAWNLLGLALLLNIIVVSLLSMPIFAFFGDDRVNVWVTYPPFIWLPAVMVLSALTGHLIVFRALGRVGRVGI